MNGQGPSPFPGTVPGRFRTDRGRTDRSAALHREPGFCKADHVTATQPCFSPIIDWLQYFKHCDVHPSADAPQALRHALVGNFAILHIAARHGQAAPAERFDQSSRHAPPEPGRACNDSFRFASNQKLFEDLDRGESQPQNLISARLLVIDTEHLARVNCSLTRTCADFEHYFHLLDIIGPVISLPRWRTPLWISDKSLQISRTMKPS